MYAQSRTTVIVWKRLRTALATISVIVIADGCASHAQKLAHIRDALIDGRPGSALAEFTREKEKPQDLLYLLERGYLEQAAGNYAASNAAFDAAELRAEELYTKSVTGELAALITSDKVLPYRSYPYELVMIQYYRVFNYLALGNFEGALIEARKANQRMMELADDREGDDGYTTDAFMQYVTGLLYESAGELNDAVVSLRAAHKGYEAYAAHYGCDAPPDLAADLYRTLVAMGMDDEARKLKKAFPGIRDAALAGRDDNVVLFVETGFAPTLEPVDIVLPIYNDDDEKEFQDCNDCEDEFAGFLVRRYGGNIYSYSGSRYSLDHVLRFSFPEMVSQPSQTEWAEVAAPVSRIVPVSPAQPLGEIARSEFNRRLPKLLLKTIARALVKEFARTRAKKKDKTLGVLINIFNVATEQSDTRTWLFLPDRIYIAKLTLPPGPATIEVVFHGPDDAVVDRRTVTVDVPEEGLAFTRVRSYR